MWPSSDGGYLARSPARGANMGKSVMKTRTSLVIAAAVVALAACNKKSPAENQASAIEANASNEAANITDSGENKASAVKNEAKNEAAEIKNEGSNEAAAVKNSASNTTESKKK